VKSPVTVVVKSTQFAHKRRSRFPSSRPETVIRSRCFSILNSPVLAGMGKSAARGPNASAPRAGGGAFSGKCRFRPGQKNAESGCRHETQVHLLNDYLHQSFERSCSEHAGHRELLGVRDHHLPRFVNSQKRRLALQNVTLVAINMTTIHSFDIEPIGRFAGLNAGIRRPKVPPP